MKHLLLIKLGGSIITDKSKKFVARQKDIKRLASEILEARKKSKANMIIGHGAGSFAHVPASRYQTKLGLINKDSLYGMSVVEDSARELDGLVVKNFLKQKLPVFPFSPASFLISDAQVYVKSYLDALLQAIIIGQIPVVYGDVIIDKSQGCTIFSTEKVFAALVTELHKKFKITLLYATDVDGVYDKNKKTIPVINTKNFPKVKELILGSGNTDVTGGMLHKVQESLEMAQKYKVDTVIFNGRVRGNLKKAVLGRKIVSTKIEG